MAKPVLTIVEWASNANYTIGPKAGLSNKADYSGIAPEGHIPGKDHPSSGNEQNDYQNKISLVALWVMAGSSAKGLDAHIVETDSAGVSRIAGIDIGGTASAQAAAVFDRNSGTGSATVQSKATDNIAFLGEAETGLAAVLRSRGQVGANSFWTAEIDGTWNDTVNPVGKVGGLRILSDTDELIAPAPSAPHPLNSRGLFVENLSGTVFEALGSASTHSVQPPGLHTSVPFAARVQNWAPGGIGLQVNQNVAHGPEPIAGIGLEAWGGRAHHDDEVTPTHPGGNAVVGHGGRGFDGGGAPPSADPGDGGDGVLGYAGVGVEGGRGGAGVHGINLDALYNARAGHFESLQLPPTPSTLNTEVVLVEGNTMTNNLRGIKAETGEGHCFQAISHGGRGLRVETQESHITPGDYGAAIALGSQPEDPANPVDGDIWRIKKAVTGGDGHQMRVRMSSENRYFATYGNPTFRITKTPGGPWTSLHNGDEKTFTSFSFDLDNLSVDSGYGIMFRYCLTALAGTGGVGMSRATATDLFTVRLYDITAGGGPVAFKNHSIQDHNVGLGSTSIPEDFTGQLIFTLAAPGQRTFELRFVNNEPLAGGDEPVVQVNSMQIEGYTWDD